MATLPNYFLDGGAALPTNPFQSAMDASMKFGATMQDFQKAQEDRKKSELKRQEAALELKAAQNLQEQQAELDTLLSDPTPASTQKLLRMSALLPKDQSASVMSVYDKLTTDQQQSKVKQAGQIYASMKTGNLDVTKSLLQQQADAYRNNGEEEEAKAAETYIKMLDINPTGAQNTIGLMMAVLPGGKEALENIDKTLGTTRAEELQPTTLRKAQAEIDEITAKTQGQKLRDLPPSIAEAIGYQNLTPEQQGIFRNIQALKKPPAAVTNIKISDLEGGSQKELAKLVPDLYDRANSAASQLNELPRYRTAVNKAITGPLAEQRLSVAKVANVLGFTGDNAINATREVIQGLSEMALQSRSMLTGQGQITEGEQKLLIKARSGDINFNKGELNTIFDVAERASKAQYDRSTKLLKSAAGKSETASMFLENVSQLPTGAAPATGQRNITVDY